MRAEDCSNGRQVRLIHQPGRRGPCTGKTREAGSRAFAQVRFPDTVEWVPVDQLESMEAGPVDPLDLLGRGKLGGPTDLRRAVTHVRLTGKLANVIYAMEATNTTFYAYQYKPLVKLLTGATNGILIADEVGLGKTIEAGLIWTELRARYDFRRLLVVCPAILRDKWVRELRQRFGVPAQTVDASELTTTLQENGTEGHGDYAVVVSMQGARPPRDYEQTENRSPAAELARFLSDRQDADPLIDLLVIDEAHYLRNPGTQTHRLGDLLRAAAKQVVLLSATPIHLRNSDLFHLVKLVDPYTFDRQETFDSVLTVNEPLVRARDQVLAGRASRAAVVQALREAQHLLLQEFGGRNQQITNLLEDLEQIDVAFDGREFRSELAHRIERANLLGHAVTRTRKRDVQEFRVVRNPATQTVHLSPVEQRFYEQVTSVVREYCIEHRVHEGFLAVTPQRQMSSSMAAALTRWSGGNSTDGDSDAEFDVLNDSESHVGPLVARLRASVRDLGSVAELERIDSKYGELVKLLRTHREEHPDDKMVLFSTYRDTLHYLARRLAADGVRTSLLIGGRGDANEVITAFSALDGPPLLLSSEVGSEGIDLQFARVIINYDLPWNPMRVEQRIGRLDRLGQKADTIAIWNFVHADTIDERIHKRLHERLELFTRSLGSLEGILGPQVQKLVHERLSARLTPEQEETRIELTAQALVDRRRLEEQLEEEAPHLIAHGDHILREVTAARDFIRHITAADIQSYVCDFLGIYFPGCRIEPSGSTGEVEINLSNAARIELDAYVRRERTAAKTGLTRAAVRCRFETNIASADASRLELITQFHPLVRFIAATQDELDHRPHPTVSVRVSIADSGTSAPPAEQLIAGIRHGIWVFAVDQWSFRGVREQEQLWFGARFLSEPSLALAGDAAEHLIGHALQHGDPWVSAVSRVDLTRAEEIAFQLTSEDAWAAFERFRAEKVAENEDRAGLQEASIRRYAQNRRETFARLIGLHEAAGRRGLARAEEAKQEKLLAHVALLQARINTQRNQVECNRHRVSVGLIMLEHADGE